MLLSAAKLLKLLTITSGELNPDVIYHLEDIDWIQFDDCHEYNISVSSNYLRFNTAEGNHHLPMTPYVAKLIAKHHNADLPTKDIVDFIWINSSNRIEPRPLGAPYDTSMAEVKRILEYSSYVISKTKNNELNAGGFKDIVIDNSILKNPKKMAIYGWHRSNGKPIQPLSTRHASYYFDYSHGVRIVKYNL